jgi:hypothetical protein
MLSPMTPGSNPLPEALSRALRRSAVPPGNSGEQQAVESSTAAATAPQADQPLGLSSVLESARPIAFNINFARLTGDAKAALFLSQLVYWTRRGADVLANDGWIYKTREQWEVETGLTRHEQLGVQNHLIQMGLIEAQKIGAPARNCYRVVAGMLGSRLAQLVKVEPVQWSLLDIQQSDNARVKALLGRQFAFYRMLTELAHSTTCAIYLSRAIAVDQRVGDAGHGLLSEASQPLVLPWDQQWFRLAVDSTTLDTGLSAAQQREAKHKLCQLGVLEAGVITHPRKQVFLRINAPLLIARLKQVLTARPKADSKEEWSRNLHLPTSTAHQQAANAWNAPGCENRTTSFAALRDPVLRFSTVSDPVLAHVSSDFRTQKQPFWPDSPNTYARTTRAQRLQGDYIENTTTTTPPQPDLSNQAACKSVDGSAAVVVVIPEVAKQGFVEPIAEPMESGGSGLLPVGSEAWIWPDGLGSTMRESAARMLAPLAKTGRLDEVQNLLDEWAGCMANKVIQSPLGYLRRLLSTHQETPGGLVWEQALVVQQHRRDRHIREQRLAELTRRQQGLMRPVVGSDGVAVGAQTSPNQANQAAGLSEVAKAALGQLRQSIPKTKGAAVSASLAKQPSTKE